MIARSKLGAHYLERHRLVASNGCISYFEKKPRKLHWLTNGNVEYATVSIAQNLFSPAQKPLHSHHYYSNWVARSNVQILAGKSGSPAQFLSALEEGMADRVSLLSCVVSTIPVTMLLWSCREAEGRVRMIPGARKSSPGTSKAPPEEG